MSGKNAPCAAQGRRPDAIGRARQLQPLGAMSRVAIICAAREGRSRVVAERVASNVRASGFSADLHSLVPHGAPVELSPYCAVLLAAALPADPGERELVGFIRAHLGALKKLPTAFVSVDLSEELEPDAQTRAHRRARSEAEAKAMLALFFEETSWHPGHVMPVAAAPLVGRRDRWLAAATALLDPALKGALPGWGAVDRFVCDLVRTYLSPLPALAAAH